jgi:predicted TIM-barrel fold metal-dependent hydrolase
MRPERAAWLALVNEDALEPEQPICDPHHHLWDHPNERYLVEELQADTGAGHNVVTTVYVDCMSGYRTDGPEVMRPVGETEWARQQAEASERRDGSVIAAIVSYADLRLGTAAEEPLAAHVEAGDGRFRGIRHATANDPDPTIRGNHTGSAPGTMTTPAFHDGLRVMADMGLTFDAWLYHPQLPELAAAANDVPGVTIVLDHLGGPLGIGRHSDRETALKEWRAALAEVATCPNVYLKVGGIGMPIYGIAWHERDRPPTSEELAAAWGDDIRFAIDAFGPQRCMFESNFPVDRRGCSYTVLWNAFKRIAAGYTADEKQWLFHDAAATAYRLPANA